MARRQPVMRKSKRIKVAVIVLKETNGEEREDRERKRQKGRQSYEQLI